MEVLPGFWWEDVAGDDQDLDHTGGRVVIRPQLGREISLDLLHPLPGYDVTELGQGGSVLL